MDVNGLGDDLQANTSAGAQMAKQALTLGRFQRIPNAELDTGLMDEASAGKNGSSKSEPLWSRAPLICANDSFASPADDPIASRRVHFYPVQSSITSAAASRTDDQVPHLSTDPNTRAAQG